MRVDHELNSWVHMGKLLEGYRKFLSWRARCHTRVCLRLSVYIVGFLLPSRVSATINTTPLELYPTPLIIRSFSTLLFYSLCDFCNKKYLTSSIFEYLLCVYLFFHSCWNEEYFVSNLRFYTKAYILRAT